MLIAKFVQTFRILRLVRKCVILHRNCQRRHIFLGVVIQLFFQVIFSRSALVSLGGIHGNLSQATPTSYTPLMDAIDPTMNVQLLAFRCLGVSNDLVVSGPMILADYEAFVPAPIVTTGISLPEPLQGAGLRDRLAENIHEVWAVNKINAGYTYAEVSDGVCVWCVWVCVCVCDACVMCDVCDVCVWCVCVMRVCDVCVMCVDHARPVRNSRVFC